MLSNSTQKREGSHSVISLEINLRSNQYYINLETGTFLPKSTAQNLLIEDAISPEHYIAADEYLDLIFKELAPARSTVLVDTETLIILEKKIITYVNEYRFEHGTFPSVGKAVTYILEKSKSLSQNQFLENFLKNVSATKNKKSMRNQTEIEFKESKKNNSSKRPREEVNEVKRINQEKIQTHKKSKSTNSTGHIQAAMNSSDSLIPLIPTVKSGSVNFIKPKIHLPPPSTESALHREKLHNMSSTSEDDTELNLSPLPLIGPGTMDLMFTLPNQNEEESSSASAIPTNPFSL